jgi:hypothetical protein
VLVVLNDCEFKGYNRFIDMHMTTKTRGRDIPELYAKKEYERIVEYIRDEYQATVKVLKQVSETLARLRPQLEGAEEGGE